MNPSIGQLLRQTREGKGLSLEAVSYHTKIPVARLQDLEGDHLTQWGGMAYTRCFVKHYADFLGLNLDEQIHGLPLPDHMAGPQDYQYLFNSFGTWVDQQHPAPPPPIEAQPSTFESRAFRIFTFLSAALLFMIMGGGITYLMLRNSQGVSQGEPSSSLREMESEPSPVDEATNAQRHSWKTSQDELPHPLQSKPPLEIPKAIPVDE